MFYHSAWFVDKYILKFASHTSSICLAFLTFKACTVAQLLQSPVKSWKASRNELKYGNISSLGFCVDVRYLKIGLDHAEMKILSVITHPHVVQNPVRLAQIIKSESCHTPPYTVKKIFLV